MSALVLHVLPLDLPRGAQRYARAMRDELAGDAIEHRTLSIFASDASVLDADVKLDTPQTWAFRRGFEPRAVRALRSALHRLRPQLLVAHGSQPLKYLAAAAPRAPQIVYYRIGIAHAAARRPARRLFHTLLLKRVTVVAGVSRECLDEARDAFGAPADKLLLIPNGRDPQEFFPPTEAVAGPPRLLFVGHLGASKRPESFVHVVEQLRRASVDFRATMVGDGPLLEVLRPRASAAGIEVLGRRNDVAQLMRESAVLLFTSMPDGEGMPGVFIEAGLSGLPVVATATPGASTVISEGKTGFVVAVDDTGALVERTRRLLLDGELRRAFARAARARCEAEFTLASSAARWSSLARQLVGSQPARRGAAEQGV